MFVFLNYLSVDDLSRLSFRRRHFHSFLYFSVLSIFASWPHYVRFFLFVCVVFLLLRSFICLSYFISIFLSILFFARYFFYSFVRFSCVFLLLLIFVFSSQAFLFPPRSFFFFFFFFVRSLFCSIFSLSFFPSLSVHSSFFSLFFSILSMGLPFSIFLFVARF